MTTPTPADMTWARKEWATAPDTTYALAARPGHASQTTDPIGYQQALATHYTEQARNHPDPATRRRFAALAGQAQRRAAALRRTRPDGT